MRSCYMDLATEQEPPRDEPGNPAHCEGSLADRSAFGVRANRGARRREAERVWQRTFELPPPCALTQ
jgi:hypothetical protein